MKVSDVMTPNPESCMRDDGVVEAARIMARRDVGFVPVVESQDTRNVLGCVTDRDIVLRVVAEGKDPDAVFVREIMTEDIISCSPEDDIEELKELMEQRQVKRILVCDEGKSLVGVVALADLARTLDASRVGETVESISQPTGATPTA